MKSVLALFISGEMYLFEDCEYSSKTRSLLDAYAQRMITEYPELEASDNNEICEWFIQSVKNHLGIGLNRVNITFIVRINK